MTKFLMESEEREEMKKLVGEKVRSELKRDGTESTEENIIICIEVVYNLFIHFSFNKEYGCKLKQLESYLNN